MSEEDKKLQKHLVDEMMKVSETNPDVMFYMEVLMKKYEELEQENINIKQQLLENKISLKDVEYQEKTKLQQKVEQLEKENIKQKEIIENLTTMTVCGDKKQIKNTAQYKLEQLEKENKILRENAEHNDKVVDDIRWKNLQLENMRKEAIEYMKEFIFEPLLINEDRKLIMFNENLKNFENILNKGDNNGK